MLEKANFYPELEEFALRKGQIEIEWVEVKKVGYHFLIKTFIQTDEEAGGARENRKAMLSWMAGNSYYHNGIEGIYENVGDCKNAPREFAIRTLLIKSQSEFLDAKGDWDYDELVKKSMHDNLDSVVDTKGKNINLKPFRKGFNKALPYTEIPVE